MCVEHPPGKLLQLWYYNCVKLSWKYRHSQTFMSGRKSYCSLCCWVSPKGASGDSGNRVKSQRKMFLERIVWNNNPPFFPPFFPFLFVIVMAPANNRVCLFVWLFQISFICFWKEILIKGWSVKLADKINAFVYIRVYLQSHWFEFIVTKWKQVLLLSVSNYKVTDNMASEDIICKLSLLVFKKHIMISHYIHLRGDKVLINLQCVKVDEACSKSLKFIFRFLKLKKCLDPGFKKHK